MTPRIGKRIVVLAASVCALSATWVPVPASAETTSSTTPEAMKSRQGSISRELEELNEALEDATASEAKVLRAYQQARARSLELAAEVRRLDAQAAAAGRDLAAAQLTLDESEGVYLQARQRLDVAESSLRRAQRELTDRAVAAYTGRDNAAMLTQAVLSAQSFEQLNATTPYLGAVVAAQARVVDTHEQARARYQDLADATEAARIDALARRDAVATTRRQLEAARRDREAIQADVDATTDREKALLAEAQKTRAGYERRIAALRAESDSITAFLRRRQSDQNVVIGSGILRPPIPGARVTSEFGPRVHPIYGTTRMHTGIDYGATSGTPIHAAAAGEVIWAGERGGYGNTVIIDHGGALATLYAHQSRLGVSAGATVAVGDIIGYVGTTGLSTGPHLHFEARVNGTPVNPRQFF